MLVQPYLFFDGRCEEALAFYETALGARVEMKLRYSENPEPPPGGTSPEMADKIMHSAFRVGEAVIMASDGMCTGVIDFKGFGLAVTLASADEVQHRFGLLADGGQVRMPPARTFFSPSFGIVADKFGVQWMLMAAPQS